MTWYFVKHKDNFTFNTAVSYITELTRAGGGGHLFSFLREVAGFNSCEVRNWESVQLSV
jgi:hypothetical protein